MMTIEQWAIKHGVSAVALAELRSVMVPDTDRGVVGTGDEAGAQALVRLEASRNGARLWRNNVGVLFDSRGVPVRYGLVNDSKQLNESIKSSDLIGIKRLVITPDHVGSTVGQFVAREMKAPGWRFTGSKRELAQLKFLELVYAMGGDAAFCTGEGSF